MELPKKSVAMVQSKPSNMIFNFLEAEKTLYHLKKCVGEKKPKTPRVSSSMKLLY
jgi:hypothetical protein